MTPVKHSSRNKGRSPQYSLPQANFFLERKLSNQSQREKDDMKAHKQEERMNKKYVRNFFKVTNDKFVNILNFR